MIEFSWEGWLRGLQMLRIADVSESASVKKIGALENGDKGKLRDRASARVLSSLRM